ncbi:benzyl alcohol O-benzoyltransferase-like isoform X2 [Silene latifolia]|uniref:benzyl alcohol O-benzoyltransferase-like isoform X2 n=1 Tax=Silene latifolia TaxID=37657 RepID=UPI003D770123
MAEIINATKSSIKFKVMRQTPELIHPACSTPYESKELSDLDSTNELRLQAPLIMFYRNPTSNINPYFRGSDPVKVIKDAIAKALVSYYPLAGRLRETSEGKLVVKCNGEGVLFIEADADVTLDDFGHPLYPPFPCSDELLYDVPGSSDILHSPLLLIQVTRLKCGGFIFALRLNHTMADGVGLAQFLNAVTELAGSTEIARLQQSIPSSTTFELISAHLWRSRTMALYDNPQESVQLRYTMNTRSK